jgi:hypothetical protein
VPEFFSAEIFPSVYFIATCWVLVAHFIFAVMNVSGKCGGCGKDWHSTNHDCPCGAFMHTWCGIPEDPENPEGCEVIAS